MATTQHLFISTGQNPKRMNELRRANWQQREETKVWRQVAHLQTLDAINTGKLQPFTDDQYPVAIVVTPLLNTPRAQDVGASYHAIKASVDGMVDAGLLADDDPKHVVALTQRAAERNSEIPGLLFQLSADTGLLLPTDEPHIHIR